jgi:hypothetical protein
VTSAATTTDPPVTITIPPSVTTTTEAPRLELSEPQVIYLLMAAPLGEPTLVPVWRDATSPQGVAGAIETLLAGPTPTERLGVPAISTDIPPETILLDADVVNGLATVDLNAAFFADGEPPAARLAQVVYTATRFAEVESVTFRNEGEPFTGLPGGAARLSFRDLQPPVFVDEPAYGGPAAQPGRLRGEARIVARDFAVTMLDSDDLKIAEFTVPRDGEGWVPFDVPLPYFVDIDQRGELRINTADGVVDQSYPLQLLLPAVGTCSAAGLSSEPVDQDLPAAVEATRRSVVEAATMCDFEALRALAGSDFTFSFGTETDPIAFWRGEEAAGIPITRLMVQLLNTPPVFDTDFLEPTYLWPAAFRALPTPEDFDLLVGILPDEDLALYREFNEYLDLRLGISQSGSWDFAVTGDSATGE